VLRKNILYKKLKLHTKHWKVSVSLNWQNYHCPIKMFSASSKAILMLLVANDLFQMQIYPLLTLKHYNQLHSRIQTISNPRLGHSGLFLNLSVAHVHSSLLIQCLCH
jgi:hypothetical protein